MAEVNHCLNIMRRLPPTDIEDNVNSLISLVPNETDELLQRIDQPLQQMKDEKTGQMFLLCDYNRHGDSYRSPWSNQYIPDIEDGFAPSEKLRALEASANATFDAYRELYYEGGVSSVYFWDLDDGFAGCFLVKKGMLFDCFLLLSHTDSMVVVFMIIILRIVRVFHFQMI